MAVSNPPLWWAVCYVTSVMAFTVYMLIASICYALRARRKKSGKSQVVPDSEHRSASVDVGSESGDLPAHSASALVDAEASAKNWKVATRGAVTSANVRRCYQSQAEIRLRKLLARAYNEVMTTSLKVGSRVTDGKKTGTIDKINPGYQTERLGARVKWDGSRAGWRWLDELKPEGE